MKVYNINRKEKYSNNIFVMGKQKDAKMSQILRGLYKEYGSCYSPLLLPKIAKYGFNLGAGPMMTAFVSKIKLYDLTTIDRENKLIAGIKMKNKLKSQISQQQGEQTDWQKGSNITYQKSFVNTFVSKEKITSQNPTLNKQNQPERSNQKSKLQQMMATYQQLNEFIRILFQRSGDLSEFIKIIQSLSPKNIDVLLKFNATIDSYLNQTKKMMDEIFPHEARRSLQIDNERRSSNLFKIRKQIRISCIEKGSQDLRNDELNTIPEQTKTRLSTQESAKFKFLKKRPSDNLASTLNSKSNMSMKRQSKFSSTMMKFNKTVPSDVPQKSFKLYDKNQKDDTLSKNTQQKFFEQLEEEHEEEMLDLKVQEKKFIRSQRDLTHVLENDGNKMIRTLIDLIPDDRKLKGFNSKKRRGSQVDETVQEENTEPKNIVRQPKQRASDIVRPKQRDSKRNSNFQNQHKLRKSQLAQSRSSISTENSHLFKKSLFNLGKNKRNTKQIKDSEQSEQIIEEKNFIKETGKRHKIRAGFIKKNQPIKDDSMRTLSINESQTSDKFFIEKTNRSRRTGKQLPHSMNKNLQRLIKDKNISKIIQINHEKENHKIQNSKKNLKKADKSYQADKLKRIKSGTQTSIIFNLPSSSQLPEDGFKTKLYIQKSKKTIKEVEKQSLKANRCDLLQLQRNLKPIAGYNESKMQNRYSMQNGDKDLQDTQFKYENGRLLFNHEFYMGKQEVDRSGDVQGMMERMKNLKRESMKFELMNKFRRQLQRSEQPVQYGYDDMIKGSQKYLDEHRERVRMEII